MKESDKIFKTDMLFIFASEIIRFKYIETST